VIRLYLITPDGIDPAPPVLEALEALPRGAAAIQLRQSLPARELLARARALRPICTEFSAPLLINDRLDVALAADADGVHLPARGVSVEDARALLGPDKLVGASTHAPGEGAGADFVVYGPVFDTPGKGPPRGLEALREACRAGTPVFALGGVDPANAWRCVDAGARGVACIRAVLGAPDIAAAARALWKSVALAMVLCVLTF
jgi:thiamine-phosphate pyrophosphorylase